MYGQTGSGKTYTMMGNENSSNFLQMARNSKQKIFSSKNPDFSDGEEEEERIIDNPNLKCPGILILALQDIFKRIERVY